MRPNSPYAKPKHPNVLRTASQNQKRHSEKKGFPSRTVGQNVSPSTWRTYSMARSTMMRKLSGCVYPMAPGTAKGRAPVRHRAAMCRKSMRLLLSFSRACADRARGMILAPRASRPSARSTVTPTVLRRPQARRPDRNSITLGPDSTPARATSLTPATERRGNTATRAPRETPQAPRLLRQRAFWHVVGESYPPSRVTAMNAK